MIENWLPIRGTDGAYEISDLGNTRSVLRWVQCRAMRKQVGGIVLKPYPVGKGHLAVSLGRGMRRKVHLLVLEHFVSPRPPGMVGCHGPAGLLDNSVANLRWDTYSANSLDAVRDGTHHWAAKTECAQGHVLDRVKHLASGAVKRYCSTCQREWRREYRRRLKEGTVAPVGRPRKVAA